jgi:hypothetical protein
VLLKRGVVVMDIDRLVPAHSIREAPLDDGGDGFEHAAPIELGVLQGRLHRHPVGPPHRRPPVAGVGSLGNRKPGEAGIGQLMPHLRAVRESHAVEVGTHEPTKPARTGVNEYPHVLVWADQELDEVVARAERSRLVPGAACEIGAGEAPPAVGLGGLAGRQGDV